MVHDPSPEDRFWLLTGEGPTGPFTAPEVRDKLMHGAATAGTKVCPVGGTAWRPLHHVPALASAAAPPVTRDVPPPAADRRHDGPAAVAIRPAARHVPRPPPAVNPRSPDPGEATAPHAAGPDRARGPSRRGRYLLLGVVAATALGVGYAALRSRLPGASAGYERGYADTVLRYADRSYEGAKWTRLKETASLAALVGAGEYSAAGLWRVAGWDADNLWVANEYGHLLAKNSGARQGS